MKTSLYYWLRFDAKDYKTPEPSPFVKWVGGKRQLLTRITPLLPKSFNTYYEPFLGGGALLLSLLPENAVINDLNKDLIDTYRVIKNEEEYHKMLFLLRIHEEKNTGIYYNEIRALDRKKEYSYLPRYIKAARLIYLNKSCYNGLFRVNSKGYFNTPFSHNKIINTFSLENLERLHRYLNTNNITIMSRDFESAIENAGKGDFIYFDPPYDETFSSYNENGFSEREQLRLFNAFSSLDKKGVFLMLSNSDTPFIRSLYKKFNLTFIESKVMTNKGKAKEILVRNYSN